MHPFRCLCPLLLALPLSATAASVIVSADDPSPDPADPNPTYTVIQQALGRGAVTTPDCTHPAFGPHITREPDAALGQVFVFHSHVTPDGDACYVTNHPRNEIKVDSSSSEYLKVYRYDSVRYRWQFRLPEGFQSSYNFTYIHQVKAVDGDFVIPLIAFNLQKGRNGQPDTFAVNHADSNGVRTTLARVDVAPFLGEWVEASEEITADTHGRYRVTLTRLRDGQVLAAYQSNDIDMWRFAGTTFIRPKWGLYRSVDNPQYLRDEAMRFKSFCLARGSDDCPPLPRVAAPVFSPAPGSYGSPQQVAITSATAGATLRYTLDGTVPACTGGSERYSGPLTVAAPVLLQAVACDAALGGSEVTSGRYDIRSDPVRLDIPPGAATASASADSNRRPAATLDRNLGTYWAAQGDGQWLQYDLGATYRLSRVLIAWYLGNKGKASFEIQVSTNGNSFTTVVAGQSSGATNAPESYALPDVSARYVRIVGHGNSVNGWNLVAEGEVWGRP